MSMPKIKAKEKYDLIIKLHGSSLVIYNEIIPGIIVEKIIESLRSTKYWNLKI